jgi:hypothetical protein
LADIHSRTFLARDRKIIELDTNVNRRKLQRELKDLQKSVYNDRRELDNAIRGDKQKLRNTLAEHKQLQLAYQNSQPKIVIEQIDQLNFTRRKVLDKLKYDKKMKGQKLIDLKVNSNKSWSCFHYLTIYFSWNKLCSKIDLSTLFSARSSKRKKLKL